MSSLVFKNLTDASGLAEGLSLTYKCCPLHLSHVAGGVWGVGAVLRVPFVSS